MSTDQDHLLTPEQLDDKYNPNGDGEHPTYTRGDWQEDVYGGWTLTGYWEWVSIQLECAANGSAPQTLAQTAAEITAMTQEKDA